MPSHSYTGEAIKPLIESVSTLRATYFREYPYLYEANPDYEKQYMQGFCQNPQAFLATINDNDQLVGMSTGLPLLADAEIVVDVLPELESLGFNAETFFYCCETIIVPEFQGKGFYRKLVNIRTEYAKAVGFKYTCFLTVERPEDHPLKPENYQSPYAIFEHVGYKPTSIVIEYDWPTRLAEGGFAMLRHPMRFWMRPC